jgi:N4-gp56 family major capsid protein
MLATSELIIKATTTTTQLSALVPKLWAARVERNLRKRRVLQQSALEFTDLLVPNSGDTLYVPLLPDLGPATSLTEGTDMSITTLSTASSVAYTPSEYGVTVEVTRKALDRIKYDGVAEVVDRLSYSMIQTLETGYANLYNASVPGTSNKMTALYANGKATGTITSQDVFNDGLILSGIAQLLSTNNLPYDDGYWMLFINPIQWEALYTDTNIRQDLRFASPGDLLTGEVGRLHGCRIIVSNWIAQTTEGAGSTVTVNNALLVAPRWSAISWKRRPGVVVDPTIYDMGRRRRFGIVADFDIELLHYERGVVLKSA